GAVSVTVTGGAGIAQLTTIDGFTTGTLTYTSIGDTTTNLVANAGGYVSGAVNVTVTDGASIAQLTAIDGLTTGLLTYTSIVDTSANLVANGGGYLTGAVNVTVADGVSIAELGAIDALTTGTVTAANLTDTAANLFPGGVLTPYVGMGSNVTVTGAATISQLAEIDAANGTGTLSYSSISDTAANLSANAGGYVTGAVNVSVTDAATIAQLTAIDGLTTGVLSYTGISDTAASLAGNAGGYVTGAVSVTVIDAATIAQLTTIEGFTTGTLTYTAIADSAANLAGNAGGYVTGAVNVAVTDAASIAQLTTIEGLTTGTLTYTAITDTAANLMPGGMASAYIVDGTNVTVTDGATLEQLAAIDAANGNGLLTYSNNITGLAADLAADALGEVNTSYIYDGTNVTVTDAATLEQLAAIDAANGGGALDYNAVIDLAANLAANADGYVSGAVNVTVTDPVSIGELNVIDNLTTGTLTYTSIRDTAGSLVTGGTASGYILDGTNVTVTDAATLAQLAGIDAANGGGTLTYRDITGLAAELYDDAVGAIGTFYIVDGVNVNVEDAVTLAQLEAIDDANGLGGLSYTDVTGLALDLLGNIEGYIGGNINVTVTDPATIAQLSSIDGLTTGTLTYTAISDAAANLLPGGVASAYIVGGIDVTATDAATIAQLIAIDGANGAGGLSYAAIRDTAENLTPGGAASGYLVAGTIVTVVDAATFAQLSAIEDAIAPDGALNYTDVKGPVVELLADANGYIADLGDVNVTATDAATVAQMSGIDLLTTGTVSALVLVDTAANLVSPDGVASGYIVPGTDVTVTDAATLAQLAAIDAANGDGSLTYGNSIAGTAADLAADALGQTTPRYIFNGTDVTVTDAATLEQLALIDAANGAGTLTYNAVADTAGNLAVNEGGYVTGAVEVTVTSAATVADLDTIAGLTTGVLTAMDLSDTAANLTAGDMASAYIVDWTNVTVEGAATLYQLALIDVANGDGALVYSDITGLAADLAADADGTPIVPGGNVYIAGAGAGTNVTVQDEATLAQLALIDAANGDGALNYFAVSDTSFNLASDQGGYLAAVGDANVRVSDAATISELTAITGLTTGTLNYAEITDTADNLAPWDAGSSAYVASDYIFDGILVTVQGEASLAQLGAIDWVNGDGQPIYTDIADTAGNIIDDWDAFVEFGPPGAVYVYPDANVTVTAPATVGDMAYIDSFINGGLTYDIADIDFSIATAFTSVGNGGFETDLAAVQGAGQVDVVDFDLAPMAGTLALDSDQFGNLQAGASDLAADDTIQINGAEIADLGILDNVGGNGTLILGGDLDGEYTVDLGTSGFDTIQLEGIGDHTVTARDGVTETFILGARQDGGSTIAGLGVGDKIDVDGADAMASFTTASQAAGALDVDAAGEWFFDGAGELTYFNSAENVALAVNLAGVTSVNTDELDTFTVAA
ncbi:MAG: hypothetical protein C4576_28225, partial [Desulfobacteraceae bacterium]